jgi:hypothetical protein
MPIGENVQDRWNQQVGCVSARRSSGHLNTKIRAARIVGLMAPSPVCHEMARRDRPSSSTVLKNLAPNTNPVTKSLCDTWQWPGKYLKLILRDVGEIDFMNAPSYIDNPTYQMKFGDRSIAAERSAEIATKKLVYRASTYTARDTFDLAAIYLYDRSALGEIAQCPAITDHVVSSALNRLNLAKHRYQSEMRKLINSTPRGEEFIDKSCEIALEALAEIRNLIPKNETEPSNGMQCS